MTVSLAIHGAIVLAAVSGGAAYARRSGGEDYTVLLELNLSTLSPVASRSATPAAEPEPTATPAPEPERAVTAEADFGEPEMAAAASESESDQAQSAAADASESFVEAQLGRSSSSGARSLERAIGDARKSWRLPSHEGAGLDLELASAPKVADCCGEPQPAPTAAVKELFVHPEVIKMARAEFPTKSQRLGEQGSVLLEMTVGVDGLVKDVKIVQTSGHSRIDDCAVAAAWDWIFKPATRNGTPIVSLARHRYTFRLTGSSG